MKEEHLDRAKFIFKESEIKTTKYGQRHLGAAIVKKVKNSSENISNQW